MRQGQPPRSTYKIALTISRRAISCGRPPGFSPGISGSRSSHSSSVTSDGYGSRIKEYFPIIPLPSTVLLGFSLSLLLSIGYFSVFYTPSENSILRIGYRYLSDRCPQPQKPGDA